MKLLCVFPYLSNSINAWPAKTNFSFHFDSNIIGGNINKMLHSVPSPLLCDSPTSHYRGSSSSKLIKRPSVDSGIHISCGQSSDSLSSLRMKNTKLSCGREIPKLSRSVCFLLPLLCAIRFYAQLLSQSQLATHN